jgi:hypothetical protein
MNISRRAFLQAIIGAFILGYTGMGRAEEDTSRRPNVVFLLADQWRASATGYAGDPNVKTPNLDKLAKESINFETAVSVCPLCTPYRASLLTGRFPTTTGMITCDIPLAGKELCMAEIFKTAGYETAYIGKWHLNGYGGRTAYIPPERRQGFDYWKATECDHNYLKSHYYLYDNQTDPWQMNNLVNKPEHAELQKQLDTQLKAGLKKIGDDFHPSNYYLDKWGYKQEGSSLSFGEQK